MNKSAITKTFNKSVELAKEYSLGFARLHALPVRVRKNFNVASLTGGVELNSVHAEQKSFLESLTDSEFKNWMALA
jgi:hypothetical protein